MKSRHNNLESKQAASTYHHKLYQLRRQLRMRQIQIYKSNIRSQVTYQNQNNSNKSQQQPGLGAGFKSEDVSIGISAEEYGKKLREIQECIRECQGRNQQGNVSNCFGQLQQVLIMLQQSLEKCRYQQSHSAYEQILYLTLKLICQKANPYLNIWTPEQRCTFSYYFQMLLLNALEHQNYSTVLAALEVSTQYLDRILKSKTQQQHFDFNILEESIMVNMVPALGVLMGCQCDIEGEIVGRILGIFSDYFAGFMEQCNGIQQQIKYIGQIDLITIKNCLHLLSLNTLPSPPMPQLSTLFYQISTLIKHMSTQQYKILEFQGQHSFLETIIEIIAVNGVNFPLETQHHKKIILLLEAILQRNDIYTFQNIQQLYACTKLPIYLLLCIFSNFDMELELMVLKIMRRLKDCYGVDADACGNLELRYLIKIGNGEVNEYYYEYLR